MRGQYEATGFDLFGCLRSVAYGLRRPTVDGIWREGELLCRPERKLLPIGQGRDKKLHAIVDRLGGVRASLDGWQVKGYAYFDGHPNTARWIRDNVIPHAESFWVKLLFYPFEDWMADGGEARIKSYVEKSRRRAAARYCPRNNEREFDVRTRLVERPELMMLTRGLYPERYAPRTDLDEMRGVLVARRGEVSIILGRTLGTKPKHGHTAHLRIGRELWMSTDDREKFMMMNYARQCPMEADAFVGGLGLGLIVLYLARRCSSIVVAEINQDVIELVWPRLRDYCREHHPQLSLRIFHGDARVALTWPGRYDYVFCDWWPNANKEHRSLVQEARDIAETHHPSAVVACWAEEMM